MGKVQFKDLNREKSAFQRTYANQVKRCDEMQRKLRFLLEEMGKAEIVDLETKSQALQDAVAISRSGFEKQHDLDELEVTLEELEHDLCDISAAMTKLLTTNGNTASRSPTWATAAGPGLKAAGFNVGEAKAAGCLDATCRKALPAR